MATSAEDLGSIVVKVDDGNPVYLRDVADVRPAPGIRFGAVTRDGQEVVLGMALSRVGENAKDVVEAVQRKLDVANSALPEGVEIRPVYERTALVEEATSTATSALLEGAILVAIVLFLFLTAPITGLMIAKTNMHLTWRPDELPYPGEDMHWATFGDSADRSLMDGDADLDNTERDLRE